MNEHRSRMMGAFRRRFVPALRELGFKGSFPHFRRRSGERWDYLTVQFYSAGGSFVLEAGRLWPEAGEDGMGPPETLTAQHMGGDNRTRIAPAGKRPSDRWWSFGPRSYDEPRPPEPQDFYDRVADEAFAAFAAEGEPWFQGPKPAPPEQGPGSPRLPWPFRPLLGGRFTHLLPWNGPRLRIACLIAPADPPLWSSESVYALFEPMDALVGRLPRPTWVNSYQSREGQSDWLPFGALKWSRASNRRWTSEYLESTEAAALFRTEFWSPSRKVWGENMRRPPELYARIEDVGEGQQAFLLALRHDRLAAAAEAADAVIAAVERLLPGAGRMMFDRVWCESPMMFGLIQGEPLDHTSARDVFQFGFAHRHLQVGSFAGGLRRRPAAA